MRMRYTIVALPVLMITATVTSAEGTDPLAPLLACRGMQDAARRLACFDQEADKLRTAVENRNIVAVDRSEVTRARRSLFGLALPNLRLFGGDNKNDPADAAARLETKITSVEEAGVGRYSMTLAEGGTWETTEATSTLYIRRGQDITIVKGGIGGYRATIGKTSYIRVRRVR